MSEAQARTFTVGEDECRAWPIPKGTIAQRAAGTTTPANFKEWVYATMGAGIAQVALEAGHGPVARGTRP